MLDEGMEGFLGSIEIGYTQGATGRLSPWSRKLSRTQEFGSGSVMASCSSYNHKLEGARFIIRIQSTSKLYNLYATSWDDASSYISVQPMAT